MASKVSSFTGIGSKTSRGANFSCLICNNSASKEHIRAEGEAGRFGALLMAVVAEGTKGRVYLSPSQMPEVTITKPEHADDVCREVANDPRAITITLYGYRTFDQLFNNRQLTALLTFSDLLKEVHAVIARDTSGDRRYADAVVTYLAFAADKAANYWSTLCGWHFSGEKMMSTLGRQALPMIWDYAEANPFSNSSGNWTGGVEQSAEVLERLPIDVVAGQVSQSDAAQTLAVASPLVSTDPP